MRTPALTRDRRPSAFRRMALGTWRTARDPSVYGAVTVEVDAFLRTLDAFRARTGRHATLTHLMALVVARVLVEVPEVNAILRWWRVDRRRDVDVFFQVALPDPVTGAPDLSGVTLRRVDRMTLTEVVDAFEAAAARVRSGRDPHNEPTRRIFRWLPGPLARPLLDLVSFLVLALRLDLRRLGVPRDPFGGVMVTNVGSLGLEEAYAPLVPYSRVPLVVSLGAVHRAVLPDGDGVRVARVLRVCATFDHRVIDGVHAARMVRAMQAALADPARLVDTPARPVTAEAPVPAR